jgi:hypothetical protein
MGRRRLSRPTPFAYPLQPHVRRHGPMGYSDHRQYRNWLRDEFSFRCVYCLFREAWLTRRQNWQIDHFVPKSIHPEGALDYDNLVFACSCCNHSKAAHLVPDLSKVGYGTCVEVSGDGEIRPLNDDGITLIEAMGLNQEDYREFRLAVFEWLDELPRHGKSIQRLFGYPKNLPDLSQEPQPPGGNKRSNGIHESCFERKKRGELPLSY